MVYRSTQAARRQLSDLAQTQGGYFTAQQAAAAGYDKQHVDYHVKAGNFERVERGLFRLPSVPPSEYDDLIRISLWSRARDDRPQAVISHETALAVHGLGELLAAKTHITVPSSFRKVPPMGCVLHKATLSENDIEEREGFRVTTPLRTLLDVAAEQSVVQEQLNEIVVQALTEGFVRRKRIEEAIEHRPEQARLRRALASSG